MHLHNIFANVTSLPGCGKVGGAPRGVSLEMHRKAAGRTRRGGAPRLRYTFEGLDLSVPSLGQAKARYLASSGKDRP